MNSDEKLLELIRQELNGFRKDVNDGFVSFRSEVNESIGSLRNEMHESIGGLRNEMHESIGSLRSDFDEFRTEVKGDFEKVHVRMDAVINMTRDFRVDVSARLDNMSAYQTAVDNQVIRHESRIRSLEERVDKLEETG